MVTGTLPHSVQERHGGEYVVSDEHAGDDESMIDQVMTYFGGHSFFLDSEHDLDAARESNKHYLQ